MRARRRRGRATARPYRGSRRRGGGGWAAFVLVVLLALSAVWLVRRARTVPPPAAPDALTDLDPVEAYRAGYARLQQHRAYESLPYFRRALVGRGDDWRLRVNYAVALNDAALEARAAGSGAMLRTRSSFERVQLLRDALAELDQAERLAPGPAERALVIASRAHRLVLWGFSREALQEFRRAQALDRSWAEVADGLEARLAAPTRPDRVDIEPPPGDQ